MTTENKRTFTIPKGETTEFRTACLSMPTILHVSPDGAFTWHEDAGRLIEEGDFTGAESMKHILRALWKAQHTAPQPAVQHMTDEQKRAGFRQKEEEWTFRGMTPWQVWLKACAWTEAAHGIGAPQAPAVQPLTDERIDEIDKSIDQSLPLEVGKRLFARAIEAAHGIGATIRNNRTVGTQRDTTNPDIQTIILQHQK